MKTKKKGLMIEKQQIWGLQQIEQLKKLLTNLLEHNLLQFKLQQL
jgi:hypothetical protein